MEEWQRFNAGIVDHAVLPPRRCEVNWLAWRLLCLHVRHGGCARQSGLVPKDTTITSMSMQQKRKKNANACMYVGYILGRQEEGRLRQADH